VQNGPNILKHVRIESLPDIKPLHWFHIPRSRNYRQEEVFPQIREG